MGLVLLGLATNTCTHRKRDGERRGEGNGGREE